MQTEIVSELVSGMFSSPSDVRVIYCAGDLHRRTESKIKNDGKKGNVSEGNHAPACFISYYITVEYYDDKVERV